MTATDGAVAAQPRREARGRRPGRTCRAATVVMLALAIVAAGAARARPAAATPEATRTEKIRLFDKLAQAPQLLVLGSSRAMRADPALLQRLTRLRSFNASVSSGTCADTWCFLHLTADGFPSAPAPRVLWLLDVEQFRARAVHPWLLSVPRLAGYLPAQYRPAARAAAPIAATTDYEYRRIYDPNGYLRWAPQDYMATHGWTLASGLADSIEKYRGIYPRGFKALGGMPEWFVRESILMLNQKGVRPVIVLTPYQPQLLAFIAGRGWPRRHQQVLAFFSSLRSSCDFVLLDMTRLKSFGGRSTEFYDGTHGRAGLMDRLVRAVVPRAAAALSPPAG